MRANHITVTIVAAAISTFSTVSQANQDGAGHQWVPKHQQNTYWQAPNWSGSNQPPSYRSPPPPAYNRNNQAPPPSEYRPPQRANDSAYAPPPTNAPYPNRGYPPPPRGPYPGTGYGPDNGASAFNSPGYHRYRGNRWSNNKFWGKSGPGKWMNPNKRNMEQGWDDMINAPSRMGDMPGGWTAPEVSMPNPVDMGDQMQDNVKDLPQQVRDMNVGNEVN